MNEPASFGTDETDPWYFKSPKHSKIAPLMCPLNGTDANYDVPPYETFSVFLYRNDTMQVRNETFVHSSLEEYNIEEKFRFFFRVSCFRLFRFRLATDLCIAF